MIVYDYYCTVCGKGLNAGELCDLHTNVLCTGCEIKNKTILDLKQQVQKLKAKLYDLQYMNEQDEQYDCNDDCLNCAKRTNKTCPKRYCKVSKA